MSDLRILPLKLDIKEAGDDYHIIDPIETDPRDGKKIITQEQNSKKDLLDISWELFCRV